MGPSSLKGAKKPIVIKKYMTPSLSNVIQNLKPSPTLALNTLAKELESHGQKIFNFTVGEPDYPTRQDIVDVAIHSLKKGKTKYGPVGGGVELRKAAAAKIKRDLGCEANINSIVFGLGAKEILFHTFLAALNSGDEVILLAPYWVSYADQIIAAGGKPVIINLDLKNKNRIDLQVIEKSVTKNTKAIVINSPNNPSGYVFREEELILLANFLHDKNWWIISDEIYESMIYEGKHISLIQINPKLQDRFIYINGLSKGYAMTGWRVGYVWGPDPITKLIKNLQGHSSTCLPPFIEEAATYALQQNKNFMEKEFLELTEKRNFALDYIQKSICNIDVIQPEGAFYLFLDCRKWLNKYFQNNSSMALSEKLIREFGVAVVPGEAFGYSGYLRLSFALAKKDLAEGLKKLGEAFHAA